MLTEIDTRTIPGNGGTVTLGHQDVAGFKPVLIVLVRDHAGREIACLPVLPAEAFDAFLHPFVDPRVPDIFKPEQSETSE